jgi:Phytanoyl-CoA dioxygenase (PhyH)
MDDDERYLFDLQGFITIPDALSATQVAELNAILDEHMARDMPAGANTHRFGGLLDWGPAYRQLIDQPTISPYLEEFVDRQFRLDHVYADIIRSGKGPIGTRLHGGASPFDSSQYYHVHNGHIYNGLSVVAYNLQDVHPGDGGFGCVPGSHKSNFPFPDHWRELDKLEPFMRAVTGPAGTAILFSEALTHGTLPWRGQGERRTIFFKYSPHPVSWSAHYFDPGQYPDLTERQRALLEAPNARYRGR